MSLYIFDKDGTLIMGYNGRPANIPEEQIVLPNVIETIAQLQDNGHKVAIASNQGGVEMGYLTNVDAIYLMMDCAQKIGAPNADFDFCPHFVSPCECRKPRPGMLLHLMELTGFDAKDTIMVGDQESDRLAAQNAGCQFQWAHDFFSWTYLKE